MSLVDYASSSGEEEEEEEEENGREHVTTVPEEGGRQGAQSSGSGSGPTERHTDQNREGITNTQLPTTPSTSVPTIALPDASLLFASPSFSSQQISVTDHSSRVAAAMNQSASRKRHSNGSALQYTGNKNPRLNISSSRNGPAPDRPISLLPPQLLGRSNVVTEDIGKFFVNRRNVR